MILDRQRAYLLALIFSSVLAWASFFSVIFFTNPQSAGTLGVAVLYASATIGLASLALILRQVVKIRQLPGGKK